MRSPGTNPADAAVETGGSDMGSPELRVGDIVEVEWALGSSYRNYHGAWLRITSFSDNPKVFIADLFLGCERDIYGHVGKSRLIHRADSL